VSAIGKRVWVVAGGHVPLRSKGPEPEFTSRDELTILNAGGAEAEIEIAVHHPDRAPVEPYRLTVAARRLRKVRVNDLIFPEAVYLDADYGLVIRASHPVVVQFTRLDSEAGAASGFTTTAFPAG
jgi:hypothetical protein